MRHGLVLVTGAGGFVGSHVVEVLREAGYEVRATDRAGADSAPSREAGASWVEADLLDPAEARRVVQGVRGVIHAAGLYDLGLGWDALYNANVMTSENVGKAAAEARVDKFVHIGSAGIYGLPDKGPSGERAAQEPPNDFEKTKQLSEEKIWRHQRFSGLRATTLRPAMIYGPRGRYAVATIMALFTLGATRDYPWLRSIRGGALSHHVHVHDVARAAALLLRSSEAIGRSFNVADDTPVRWGELLQYVGDLSDFKGPSVPLHGPLSRIASLVGTWMPSTKLIDLNKRLYDDWEALITKEGLDTPLLPRLDRDLLACLGQERVCDTSAIRALGFAPAHPVTLNGIRDTFDSYKAHGWLPGRRDLAQG